MADLEELISRGEGIKNKKLRLFGLKVTGASIVGALALISTILGSLYGGFLMYQKVERIANLNLGSISSQMKKTSAEVLRIEEHTNTIKVEIKKDITDLRDAMWNLESKTDNKLQSVDTKLTIYETKLDTKLQSVDTKLTNYDTKLDRFEIKLDKTKQDMNKQITEALNNPLAN